LNDKQSKKGKYFMRLNRDVVALAALLISSSAFAQYTDGVIKIGVLTDMSGLYSDTSGAGSVVAAKMAVQDFDATAKGMKVEIVSADHQNKADLGSTIARSWFDVNKVDGSLPEEVLPLRWRSAR
jgi:branched-chain amino acid transport system substrate-binding protein